MEQVRERLERSDAVVSTIGLGRGSRDEALKGILERLATASGGRAFMTERIERLERAFSQILDELGNTTRHLLPTNAPGWHVAKNRRHGRWRT